MFVDTANVPSVRASYQGILARFGVVDIEWSPGERLDDTSVAFVYPHVK